MEDKTIETTQKTTHNKKKRHYIPYKSIDFYRWYRDSAREYGLTPVDVRTFRAIISIANKYAMQQKVILEGQKFFLPHKCGMLYIKRDEVQSPFVKQIDYKLTKKYDQVIFHLNQHSNFYRYRFKWKRGSKRMKLKCSYSYRFISAKENKRKLADAIRNKNVRYL